MGLKIALVGAQSIEPECTHWNGISQGMRELEIDYYPLDWRATSAENILQMINSIHDLDLLIWGLFDPFERPDIMKAAKANKRAFWCADLRDDRTGGYPKKDLSSLLDFTMQSNNGLLDLWEKHQHIPSYYIGQAGFEGQLIDSPYRDLDCVFIGGKLEGGLHGERMKMLKQIDFPFEHINKDTLPERMEIYAEMPTIYSTAKICLEASQVWDVDKYCSARYFHIAANGGFSIAKRFEGCEDLFPEGVGKIYFDTPEEATELLKYWSRPTKAAERRSIAAAGKEHALSYHTYTNRIHDICNLL